MAKEAKAFDAAAYLDTPEAMTEYMAAAMETGDAGLIKEAVGDIIRARGMTAMAKVSGVSRATLYRAFGEGGNPTLDNMFAVLNALGVKLSVKVPGPRKVPVGQADRAKKKAKTGSNPCSPAGVKKAPARKKAVRA